MLQAEAKTFVQKRSEAQGMTCDALFERDFHFLLK